MKKDFLSDPPCKTDNNQIETVAECKLEKFEFIAVPISADQVTSSMPQIESIDNSNSPPTDQQILKDKNILECKVLVKKLDFKKIKKSNFSFFVYGVLMILIVLNWPGYRLTESGTYVKRPIYKRGSPWSKRRKFIKKTSSPATQVKTPLKIEPTG